MTLTENKKYYTIGSVEKVCDLLEVLAERDAWDLNDLAQRLGQPKTTVHRFLLTLLDRGYVFQEKRRGRYSLSYKLFSIASSVVEKTSLLKIARPFEEKLLAEVGETVNLTVPNSTDMLVVDKQVSPKPLRQDIQLGSTFSMINSASGRIFLAFANPVELARVATAIKTSKWPGAQEKFDTFLTRIPELKKTGFDVDNEEQFAGIRCLAAPILNNENFACAAMSVSIPSLRYSQEIENSVSSKIVEACSQISARLGADAY